jgi:hypothetical protein
MKGYGVLIRRICKAGYMRNTIVGTFAASTMLLAGCCATPHVTKWEYRVEDTMKWTTRGTGPEAWRDSFQSHLNELGKEGWMLIMERDGRIAYFKRPIE